MARVFNRGELKLALLSVIASLGEGHGYAIMQELQRRVGSQWRPSPGAIYPALVTLEEAGLITSDERDGLRVYRSRRRERPSWRGRTSAPAGATSPAAPTRAARASPSAACSTASSSASPGARVSAPSRPRASTRRSRAHATTSPRSWTKEQNMDEFGKAALREREAVRIARRQWFWMDLIVWAAISVFLFLIWWLAGGGVPLVRDRRRGVGHRRRRPRRLRLRPAQPRGHPARGRGEGAPAARARAVPPWGPVEST